MRTPVADVGDRRGPDPARALGHSRLLRGRIEAQRVVSEVTDQRWRHFLEQLPLVLRSVVADLSKDVRGEDLDRILGVLQGVPNLDVWMKLLEIISVPFSPCNVAFVGPVNSGKSSLFNAMAGRALARVHAVPGTTRDVQIERLEGFVLADTPGADDALGEDERQKALDEARRQYLNILVFDATVGINQSCKDIYDTVKAFDTPVGCVVVLNKIDLVRRERDAVLADAASKLGIDVGEILPVSAKTREGLSELMTRLIVLHPDLAVAIGPILDKKHRDMVARRVVMGTAGTAATVGLTPIPLADIVPLTALQVGMIISVGRVYAQRLDAAAAKALITSLGGGIGLREVARALVKLVPGAGSVASAAIAAAGTLALGSSAIWHFSTGKPPLPGRVRQVYRSAVGRLRRLFRRPDVSPDEIEEVLDEEMVTTEGRDHGAAVDDIGSGGERV